MIHAPIYYKKMTKFDVPIKISCAWKVFRLSSTRKRKSQSVARPETTEKALLLYNNVRGRRGVE